MRSSRINSIIFPFVILILAGCSSPGYRVDKKDGRKIELKVTPERIALECEEIPGREVLYGFMIHVLDDENTIMDLAQGNRLDKKTCLRYIERISLILKKGRSIYLAGIGNLDEPRVKGEFKYTFPKLGTFFTNGRSLHFFAIANEHGGCFHAYNGEEKPCPRDEFPIP
jgi:hypothetical protein